VERRAVVGLLQQIDAERRGDTVDRVLLGHVLRSLTNLGIYQTAFQTPFLQQTQEFYATEGLQLMASSDVPDYIKHAEVANRHLLSTTFSSGFAA
jgi:cullin-4